MVGRLKVALGALALAVLPAAAIAAPAKPQYALVIGMLTSMPGGTTGAITVTTPSNTTVTIPIGVHTRYLARTSAAFKAGLKSGDQVVVFTSTTKSGTVAVTVEYDLKPFGVSTRVAGTIAAGAASGTLTLTTAAGSALTLTTDSKTKYALDNHRLKVVTAIPANEPALIAGLYMTTGVTEARFVSLGLPAKHVSVVVLHGTVATQEPTTLALSTSAKKTLQVAVTATTAYVVDGTLSATAPTITPTEKVQIFATKGTGGVYTASSVWVKTH